MNRKVGLQSEQEGWLQSEQEGRVAVRTGRWGCSPNRKVGLQSELEGRGAV